MKNALRGLAKCLPRLLFVLVAVGAAGDLHAFGPFGLLRTNAMVVQPVAPSYAEKYHHLNERYPKFYGGFHSSYFHDMGVPSGDLGIRGNGIYPTPW